MSITRVPATKEVGDVLLSAEMLSYVDTEGIKTLDNINLDLRAGEILGVAGVEGNGQSELSRLITGLLKPSSGTVIHKAQELTSYTTRQIRESGICHIPEDRMENGIAATMGLDENLIADRYYKEDF
ncbi:MAG: ATP-binding cassette domain-containing protein, partial [Sphaerochaetaceae bacterium]|nr:ATP-binding cassette domain-containing protein [Sphaerochaetaceae bacterium]